MSLPKLFAIITFSLFGIIGFLSLFTEKESPSQELPSLQKPVEIVLDQTVQTVVPAAAAPSSVQASASHVKANTSPLSIRELPDANRIEEFFNKTGDKLPIVETITYKSHVPWQKGRPAWLSDYAAHYNTSRHFIARSLNGKPDYLKQELAEGDKFNVLRQDKNFEFYLLVDTSRCKMWFYYIDLDANAKVLLKTYSVGLGRLDSSKASGLLTPLGKYTLGDRIAVFKPKAMGNHKGKKVEMITVFGTRWIPFEQEIGECTLPAKGFGVHGTPWEHLSQGNLADNIESIGKYDSDGCVRLSTPDMEELFAIIITKPTTIEIVPDFFSAK